MTEVNACESNGKLALACSGFSETFPVRVLRINRQREPAGGTLSAADWPVMLSAFGL